MTQEEIAESVGKSRPVVANMLRLLTLSDGVKKMIVEGSLSAGHARCIAAIKEPEVQNKVAAMVVAMSFTVRQTEEYVKKLLKAQEVYVEGHLVNGKPNKEYYNHEQAL